MTELAEKIGAGLKQTGKVATTAESCTGGWIAQEITDVPGSSAWFDCGFVTYSNAAKQRMLGVKEATLQQFGAVSEEVVTEMVSGALRNSAADIAVATSGIAGPDGGSDEKPVGTVWFAWGDTEGEILTEKKVFSGDRENVRKQAVSYALNGFFQLLGK